MSRPTVDGNCWAQETQPGSDDTSPLDLCPRPFKGLVICATGILDKVSVKVDDYMSNKLTTVLVYIIQASR